MASCEPCHPRVGGIWTWGQIIIWGGFYEGSLPPAPPLSTPPPPLPLPVCPMLAAGCPGLASAVRSHFPSPQWVRHSLLLSTPFSTPPPTWAGVAWKEGERGGRRESGVNVFYKGSCLLAFCVPLPTYPCPGAFSVTPGFVCASSQGRRWSQMGGGLLGGGCRGRW